MQFVSGKYLGNGIGQFLLLFILLLAVPLYSQDSGADKKTERQVKELLKQAQQSVKKDDFSNAEAYLRKAIAADPKGEVAKYNLGTAYYDHSRNEEAQFRFSQAVKSAKTREERHRAFHNLGNTFMNEENYQAAVEAYKDALRNNPRDEETRYNLALAKELLEKNPPPPEEDEDQDQQQDQQDEQDQQDQQQDQNDDDQDQDQDSSPEPDQSEEGQGSPQPVPGQLTPEQIESLLDAMDQEEKKVQDKMNAEKQKGVKVEPDKYW